jgi:hypothetical protein
MSEDTLNIDKKVAFSASTPDGDIDFSHSEFKERVGGGFNQHGVRKNFDEGGNLESVDVIYEAMEPGPPERRNGVRITKGFLDKVGSKDYDDPPHLKDHDDKDTFSKIGSVKETWFSDRIGKLMLMTRTPNIEGSSNHSEAIARYTHEPPSITDGSLGFGNEYEAIRNEDGEPEMKDGKFREFSTTNFPGGYDEGGVKAAFEEAVEEFAGDGEGDMGSPDMEELSKVYEEYTSMMNMSEQQMEMWEEHPCSDKGVDGGENHRDEFMMLSGQPMEEWDMENLQIANRVIDFLATQLEEEPENPESGGPGTCPSRWAVSMLNRGHNPFDSFPRGNPQFSLETVDVTEFDDAAQDDDKSVENSAAEEFAVNKDTIQF